MNAGLDHVVLVVPDLQAAVHEYVAAGFHVEPGGRHIAAGTSNALIPLQGGCYLELFTFDERRPEHSLWPVYERGGGLGQFWLRSENLPAEMRRMAALGCPLNGPREGRRTREDGQEVRFAIATVRADPGFFAPCFIQDLSDVKLRHPPAARNRNGVTSVESLRIELVDTRAAIELYTAIAEPAPEQGAQPQVSSDFMLGGHRLSIARFAQANGVDGAVARQPGPTRLVLRTTEASRSCLSLPGSGDGLRLSRHVSLNGEPTHAER